MISDFVVECFDHTLFDAFLVRNNITRLANVASPYVPMPAIAVSFLTWLHRNPEAIEPFLNAALADFPHHAFASDFRNIAHRQSALARSRPTHPWEATLAGGVPVANRAYLRRILEDASCGRNSGVAMINGPSRTGRSHSWYLINAVANRSGIFAHRFALADLPLEEQTLEGLFNWLNRRLRLAVQRPSMTGATPATIAYRLAQDLIAALHHDPQTHWLVFDGLDGKLEPEMRLFLIALANARLEGGFIRGTLFLLGADSEFGVTDPFDMIDTEILTELLPEDLAHAAAAINGLGRRALERPDLQIWLRPAMLELTRLHAREVNEFVAAKLVELRKTVS